MDPVVDYFKGSLWVKEKLEGRVKFLEEENEALKEEIKRLKRYTQIQEGKDD